MINPKPSKKFVQTDFDGWHTRLESIRSDQTAEFPPICEVLKHCVITLFGLSTNTRFKHTGSHFLRLFTQKKGF